MTLEEKITKGKVTYIHSLNYDGIKSQIQINLLYNPENPSVINMIVTFDNLSDLYIEQVEKEDEDYFTQIIGIDEYKEENTVKYVIQTDIKTIIFKTEIEPLINETK